MMFKNYVRSESLEAEWILYILVIFLCLEVKLCGSVAMFYKTRQSKTNIPRHASKAYRFSV